MHRYNTSGMLWVTFYLKYGDFNLNRKVCFEPNYLYNRIEFKFHKNWNGLLFENNVEEIVSSIHQILWYLQIKVTFHILLVQSSLNPKNA